MLDVLQFQLKIIKKTNQRKTTLIWTSKVELSYIDMARIIKLLANKELTQCSLACDANKNVQTYYFN